MHTIIIDSYVIATSETVKRSEFDCNFTLQWPLKFERKIVGRVHQIFLMIPTLSYITYWYLS
jgi:hypothetical protein